MARPSTLNPQPSTLTPKPLRCATHARHPALKAGQGREVGFPSLLSISVSTPNPNTRNRIPRSSCTENAVSCVWISGCIVSMFCSLVASES
eukprot:1505618-Rhodomonas_salina.1